VQREYSNGFPQEISIPASLSVGHLVLASDAGDLVGDPDKIFVFEAGYC